MPPADPGHLLEDPRFPWPHGSAYRRLRERLRELGQAEIGPQSGAEQIQDVLYDLMSAGRPSREERQAWDELRLLDRRLAIDFLLYQSEETEAPVLTPLLRDRPPPVSRAVLRQLLDVGVVVEGAIETPGEVEPGRRPGPLAVPETRSVAPPVDVGPLHLRPDVLLGDDDEG